MASEDEFDLIVVGAGAAGMTAALVAAQEGLKVALFESGEQLGGTTSTSAGTLWVPGNHQGVEAGFKDSVSDARKYLEHLLGGEANWDLIDAYLASTREALDYLEEHSEVHFTSSGKHPDYLSEPGAAIEGRTVSPLPFDGRRLGADFVRVRPPIQEFMVLGGMMVGKADIQLLTERWTSWRGFSHMLRLVGRYFIDRLQHPRGTHLVMGNALVARLFYSLRALSVEIRFGYRLERLEILKDRIVGAHFRVGHSQKRIAASRGVVLATGGVGHNKLLRKRLLQGETVASSLACETVQGEGLRAAEEVGGWIEEHAKGNFFWQPYSFVPNSPARPSMFPHLFLDRAKPGLIAVDADGSRFTNEAASYHHFVDGMLSSGAVKRGRVWLICDSDFVRRYGLGVVRPGTVYLTSWERRGYLRTGRSLAELARKIGVPASALETSIEQANRSAEAGVDLVFGKGSTEVNLFNGDSMHAPNPCLGPISMPPYVALEVRPADAASSAGLRTDSDGKVLGRDGRWIGGLYACGNDAASVMRGTYPGPGTTLGPAMVFAYRIARNVVSSKACELL